MRPVRPFSVLLYDFRGHSHILLATLRALASIPALRVHLLADRPREPARFSRCRSSFTLISPADDDAQRLEAIAGVVRRKGIDVLLPCGETATRFSSDTFTELSALASLPPLPSRETFALTRDKWLFTKYLSERGIPVPETRLLASAEQIPAMLQGLRLPVLFKPRFGAGGLGIRKAGSAEEFERVAREALALRQEHCVQEFVPGEDYGCSLLGLKGEILAHTEQRWIVPASGAFAAAAGNSYHPVEALLAEVGRIARLIGWSGVANIDARCDSRDGKFRILEWNPRFWRSLLGSAHAGVNFPLLACLAALGIPPERSPFKSCRYVHENRASLRLVLRRAKAPDGGTVRFRETVLPHVLRDPLADAALLLPYQG